MSLFSRIFRRAGRIESGKSYQVTDPKAFNQAACFGGKVAEGETLVCMTAKSKTWPYPTFKRANGVAEDAPHGTREIISMTHKAKGSPSSYGLKAPGGPGQHGGFGG